MTDRLAEHRRVHVSVGVDIGSSTSHLVFSRLELEQRDSRYIVKSREVLYESDILLTPYKDNGTTIDSDKLGQFIADQYTAVGIAPSEIDTGALILTGVAVRRQNARAIGELDRGDFGLLPRLFVEHGKLLSTIIDKLKTGEENLDVINWAIDENIPMEHVRDI